MNVSYYCKVHKALTRGTVSLLIGNFHSVVWNKKAFSRLVHEEKTKEMIRALVDVQKSRDNGIDDIIRGKGSGLILLLHGSPGTGKVRQNCEVRSSNDWQANMLTTQQTLTAERQGIRVFEEITSSCSLPLIEYSVAELAEKPLYRVTCGDIGTDAEDVEKYLRTVLHLGKIWDCG